MEETRREAAAVVELLDLRQGGLAQTLDGNFPDLRTSVWQSEGTVQAAVQVRPAHNLQLIPSFSSLLINCLPVSTLSIVCKRPPIRPAALLPVGAHGAVSGI